MKQENKQITLTLTEGLCDYYTNLAKEYGWSKNDMFLWCLEHMQEEIKEWDK